MHRYHCPGWRSDPGIREVETWDCVDEDNDDDDEDDGDGDDHVDDVGMEEVRGDDPTSQFLWQHAIIANLVILPI